MPRDILPRSEFIPPSAETEPRETEGLPVSQVLQDIPRLDGQLPRETRGQRTTFIDEEPPGVLAHRQSEFPLTERDAWHEIETPTDVARLWNEVMVLQEKADDIRDAVAALPGQKAAEQRQVEAQMAEAIRAGKPAEPVGTLTDWTRRQLALVTEHRVVVERLRAKRAEYDAAVTAAVPEWRRKLVDAVLPARAEAQKLVGPALAAVADWRAKIAAAHQMSAALDPTLPNPSVTIVGERGRQIREARQAPEKLAVLLADEDPRVSGAYLALPDEGIRPTRWEREAMRDGALGGWAQLAYVENNEGYRVTAYTKKRDRHDVMPTAPFRQPDGSLV
jgi:hypothetical protein